MDEIVSSKLAEMNFPLNFANLINFDVEKRQSAQIQLQKYKQIDH